MQWTGSITAKMIIQKYWVMVFRLHARIDVSPTGDIVRYFTHWMRVNC